MVVIITIITVMIVIIITISPQPRGFLDPIFGWYPLPVIISPLYTL
jgi:hypothetical protein